MPSQTGAYKLVLTTLSFRCGTKKSHPEQQACGALMGRPIKKDSATLNGATLRFVKPCTLALPCCTYDRRGPLVPCWRKGSSTQNGATPSRVAPLLQALQKEVGFLNSFKLSSFYAKLLDKGHFCRFHPVWYAILTRERVNSTRSSGQSSLLLCKSCTLHIVYLLSCSS
jgi:hypothetical protein